MKKVMIFVSFLLVFICAGVGSFLFVKNTYNTTDNKNEIIENREESKKENRKNEHIIDTNRFATDWEWNNSIVETTICSFFFIANDSIF